MELATDVCRFPVVVDVVGGARQAKVGHFEQMTVDH